MISQKTIRVLGSFLTIIALAACSPDQSSQDTTPTTNQTTPAQATAEPAPSESAPTEQPQPTTDTGYTWQAQPVLISMQDSPGNTDPSFAWGIGPDLIVYADGRLIYSDWSRSGNERGPTYWVAQLPAADLCDLLVQIDNAGFYDLSPDDYVVPAISDAEETTISINSWRSKTFEAYSLAYAVNHPAEQDVEVPPGLAETFRLLSTLRPAEAIPYEPESVSLLVTPVDLDIPAQLWPLETPKLSELAGELELYDDVEAVFEGQTAANLSELFNGALTKYYEDAGRLYAVTIRPLFPHEIYSQATGWGRLSQFETTPTTEMSCPTN